MKITMFGATGPTGKHFTALALKNGHEVTALVRDASKLSAADKLSIVVGDATDEKAVKRVIDGAGKLMRIRTFVYLPPKAGFNWRGPARR